MSAAAETWLRELFEHERCAECGGDWDNHDCIPSPLGHPFAQCRIVPAPDCPDDYRLELEMSELDFLRCADGTYRTWQAWQWDLGQRDIAESGI